MPKLTIEVDQCAWQRLREQAELQGLMPEMLAQQLLMEKLRAPHKGGRQRHRDREHPTGSPIDELLCTTAALPRGSLHRVFTTLELIQAHIPLNTPPPSREEVDAYLEQERASWENSDGV